MGKKNKPPTQEELEFKNRYPLKPEDTPAEMLQGVHFRFCLGCAKSIDFIYGVQYGACVCKKPDP